MRPLKPFVIFAALIAALAITSCKKDKSASVSQQQPEECVVGRGANTGAIIPGQYIVSLKSSSTSITTRAMSTDRVAAIGKSILQAHAIRENALQKSFPGEHGGFVAHLSDEEAKALKSDESVDIVEPDRVIALGACFTVVEPRLVTWSVSRVGYGDGTGKTAWIIDSGIDFDHPDLNVDVTRSKSFLANNTSARDENGHGTHVAGIIGAKNNSFGILGVASGANLVSLRVLDASGDGVLSSIIQALAYVNANGKAGDVVNMSLGEDVTSATLDQQVKNTASKGIFIAIAAGNDSQPAINYSPGRANGPNIYTVSAIDSLDNFASFSNYGNDAVDIAAPGVKILSTYLNNRYAIMSGTSMATPHVAGLLLLKGNNINHSGTAQNDPDGTPDPIAHF
ncbi:MAG: S8 family peptidase [Bacteroidetes bacterium]|jgi:subtilisin|nr:MAG: S8 family peptidase [Bacteroidota bacterium]